MDRHRPKLARAGVLRSLLSLLNTSLLLHLVAVLESLPSVCAFILSSSLVPRTASLDNSVHIMSGKKRRRKLKSLNDAIADNRRTANEVKNEYLELQNWSDLPAHLLELILSQLTLEDNIHASAVCKSWHSVATAVRVVNQSPWLMYFPKFGSCYDFHDPVQRKTHYLELPELSGSRIVAFSCAPTSPGCVLFTVKHVSPTVVAISTCFPGATEWATVNYQNRLPFVSSIWNKLVFCNGLFYCLSLTGWLGVLTQLNVHGMF
ncbi:hypothetical protein K1719_006749 [Acacia pycnantha]|nr:hypothetical protein K1719_006749 [Acacia pycnantha]